MQSKIFRSTIAILFVAALTGSARLIAQDQSAHNWPTHYHVYVLPPFSGGASSVGNAINQGWVTGASNLAGNTAVHATLWAYGTPVDLGTLGGANSGVEWPFKNDQGKIVGISETATVDPSQEQWSCSAFFIAPPTLHTCVGFVWHKDDMWQNGVMDALPTLGGNNGYASGSNSAGQIVGWAENTVHDPTCNPPQVFQFEAVIYGPGKDQIHQLSPFHGDPDGAATAINDKGQVVGISGICDNAVGAFSAKHAVLWQNGEVINLGTLGGQGWNTPYAINNRGQVVGFSDLHGDVVNGVLSFNARAFIWTKESGMKRLTKRGALPTDLIAEAEDINDRGQVVGLSCGATTCRAFLWQDGVMVDLNTLIPPDSPLYLTSAGAIDEHGVITGQACVLTNGACLATAETPAFVAVPVSGDENDAAAATDDDAAPQIAVPEQMRQRLLRPKGFRNISPEPVPAQ